MMKEAVVIVLRDELGRFLMGKRSLEKSLAAGYWVPIAGTIESNESERDAVIRECREEIGVEVEPTEKIAVMKAVSTDYLLHWWKARIVNGSPQIKTPELTELRWVSPEELSRLKPVFAEDIELLLRLNE